MSEIEWQRLKAHELRALADQDAIVVLPTASIEQHGPHLPVMTDTRLGHEVAVRAARKAFADQPTVVLPVLWCGLSEHHMPYGGTITLDHAAYTAVVSGIVRSVLRHGFKRVLLSNSHGGNILANQTICDQLAIETGAILVSTTYAKEGAKNIAPLLEDQPGVMHGGEAETSMMMAVEGALVDNHDLASLPSDPGPHFLSAGEASYRWRPFQHMTGNGVSGNPTNANADKGEMLLDVASDAVAALLTDASIWQEAGDKRGNGTGGVSFRN